MYSKEDFRNREYRLAQFLGGHFHQDAGSAEKGLTDFLESVTQDDKKEVLDSINRFLLTNEYSLEEKQTFINDNIAVIVDPAPIEWLQNVANQIEEHLKN